MNEALDEQFMSRALDLAREALDREEVPVGAVLVRNGEIVAEGSNEVEERQDCTAHAEIVVIQAAQVLLKTWRLNGLTLYVTKEPCPMCAGALLHARVDRIVFGIGDPKAGACGGAYNLFDLPGINHRCVLTPGVKRDAALGILQEFFREQRRKGKELG